MSQTNTIVLKRSSVSGRVPSAESLKYGEVALNYKDEKLYFKNSNNVVKSFDADGRTTTVTDSSNTEFMIPMWIASDYSSGKLNSLRHVANGPTYNASTFTFGISNLTLTNTLTTPNLIVTNSAKLPTIVEFDTQVTKSTMITKNSRSGDRVNLEEGVRVTVADNTRWTIGDGGRA